MIIQSSSESHHADMLINKIQKICSEQLGLPVEKVPDKVNLIQTGLDSIGFMQCLYFFQQQGYAISLQDLYRTPTIYAWKQLLGNRSCSRPQEQANDIEHNIKTCGDFPLTPVQHAYLVGRSRQQTLGGVACQMYQEFDGGAALNAEALKQAVGVLVQRHPMLSVRFNQEGRQSWHPSQGVNLVTCHDYQSFDEHECERRLLALREQFSHQVLDVEHGQSVDFHLVLLPGAQRRLLANVDMLVADGTSYALLFTELSRLLSGKPLAKPDKDYDFYRYLKQKVAYEEKEAAYQYWQDRLDTLPDPPLLPLKQEPKRIRQVKVKRLSWAFSQTEWDRFTHYARQYHVTPSMAIASCFSSVLARWTGQNRLLLNFTLFDRKPIHPSVSQIISDFTNVILLDMQTDHQSLITLAQKNQETFIAAWQHADYSGVDVLRDLRKNGTHFYGCPVVFTSHINQPLIDTETEPVLGTPGWGISQTPQVWLDHMAINKSGHIVLQWDYNADLFPADLIDELFDAYISRIRQLATESDAWQTSHPELMPSSQQDCRLQVNDTGRSLPVSTLHDAIFSRYRYSPAIALIDNGKQWDFKTLLAKASDIAAELDRRGIKPGERVGICMPKGVGQVISALAILHAGATYVPVDVAQPSDRIKRIGRNAGLSVVIVSEDDPKYCDYMPFCDDLIWQQVAQVPDWQPDFRVSPDQAAYVIYTSGSTGDPKGVVVSHTSAMNTCLDLNERYHVTEQDRVLAISAQHFDLSVYDMFGLLNAGGCIVLVKDVERRNPDHWLNLIRKYKVTLWNSVPALFDMLLTYTEGMQTWLPEHLRLVYLSGDWVGLDLAPRYYSFCPGGQLVAMGGATEAAIWSNYFNVERVDPAWNSIPYGYPLSNQYYRVVDARGEDCPDWVPGELWIGGAGVAIEYLNEPEKNAEQFVCRHGRRWYRTGDMGRYRSDGVLEFLGRRDRQVKIGGYRIEPGEIDAAMYQLNGVRNAVTLAVGEKEKVLHSFVVLHAGGYQHIDMPDPRLPASYQLVPGMKTTETDIQEASMVAAFLHQHLVRQGIHISASSGADELSRCYGCLPQYDSLMGQWLRLIRLYPEAVESRADRPFSQLSVQLDRHESLLSEILRGSASPLALLDDSFWSPEHVVMRLNGMSASLESLIQQIRMLNQSLGRPVRIIQPGARSGLSAHYILSRLPSESVHLIALDESAALMSQAKARLSEYRHAEVSCVSDQALQQYRHSADIVWVNNYLHRSDVPASFIDQMQLLAAPGALFFIQEASQAPAQALVSISLFRDEKDADPLDKLRTSTEWHELFLSEGVVQQSEITHDDISTLLYRAKDKIVHPDRPALEQDLRRILPEYMIPRNIHFLPDLPLTPNGKIDNRALKALCRVQPQQPQHSMPENETEKVVMDLWKKLLGTQYIQRQTHFFREGGDSLVATRLIGELSRQGYRASLEDIFSRPVLTDFATSLERVHVAEKPEQLPHDEHDRYSVFPLTDIQQAYLVGRQRGFALGGVGTHFFVDFIAEHLQVQKLEDAINRLICRHDMLRAVIRGNEQKVLEHVPPFQIRVHHVTSSDSPDFNTLREQCSCVVYNPENWPSFGIDVVETETSSSHVFISLDNLFLDGMSMQILFSELKTLYQNPAHHFTPLSVTFRDYMRSENAQERSECAWKYWQNRLRELPSAPQLPLCCSPEHICQPRFSRLQDHLSSAVWDNLQQVAVEHELTPPALLLASYTAVLSAWSREPDLTLNLTLFNRQAVHPQIDEILGDFTSLQLLDWKPEPRWLESALHMQQRLHQDMQFRAISAIRVMREMARQKQSASAGVPVVFTCALGYSRDEGFLSHQSWLKPVWGISQTPQTWLDHQVYEADGELHLNWDYVESLFEPAVISEMFNQYIALLRTLASEPQAWSLPLNVLVPRHDKTGGAVADLAGHLSLSEKQIQPLVNRVTPDSLQVETFITSARASFREIVGVTLSPEQNFFDAGASSLQLVQFHVSLQKQGYVQLTITDLFACPNLTVLSEKVFSDRPQNADSVNAEREQQRKKRKKRLQMRTEHY